MDKDKLLTPDETLSEIATLVSLRRGPAAVARSVLGGGSAAHLADVLHNRRPISAKMAEKFGYRRVTMYERVPARPDPFRDNPSTCPTCGGVANHHSVDCFLSHAIQPQPDAPEADAGRCND